MTQHSTRAASPLPGNSLRGRLPKRPWPVRLVLVAALLLAVPFLFHAGSTVHAADNEITGVTLTSLNPGELTITWEAPSAAPDNYRVTWKKSSAMLHLALANTSYWNELDLMTAHLHGVDEDGSRPGEQLYEFKMTFEGSFRSTGWITLEPPEDAEAEFDPSTDCFVVVSAPGESSGSRLEMELSEPGEDRN